MKITLVPYAGLCNRLNAIASGLAYMQEHPETELTIKWHKWYNCNCRFNDLFKQLDSCYPPVKEMYFDIKDIPGHKLNLNIPQWYRPLFYDFCFLPTMSADKFDELTTGSEKVYVYKDNRFCRCSIEKSLADIFIPTDEIQSRINEITRNWSGNVVGLHIRRTDNTASIANSPISHFYEVIENELSYDASTRFYVATDDKLVKEDLIQRYGDKAIISPDFCLKRSSLQGMKDAVVDLYSLGKTKKIFGSAASTYSIFASKLFNSELII